MLYPPGFYFVKKPKRFVILSSDKSSERNLSSFFDIKNPRRIEHLQSEEPFSSGQYISFLDHPTVMFQVWYKSVDKKYFTSSCFVANMMNVLRLETLEIFVRFCKCIPDFVDP